MSAFYSVSEIKSKIAEPARRYGIEKAYLYGSYARGEARAGSDMDICIEKGSLRTLFELSSFCQELEEIFGNKVDVVTSRGLSGEFRQRIEKDLVLIYG